MAEENKQPPEGKRSFVSEKDIPPVEGKSQEPKKEIPPPEVTLMLCYGKLSAILEELQSLNAVFHKVSKEPIIATPITSAPTPITTPAPDQPRPVSARILEIRKTLEPFMKEDLLIVDEETSTMSVLIKPKQFLGSENFAKVASAIRAIGGQYVSAGKNSHFEVPKAEPKK